MLERKEVVEKMKRYNRNCSIIKELKIKIQELEKELNNYNIQMTAQYEINGDIRSKNKKGDKVINTILSKEKENNQIKSNIDTLKERLYSKEREVEFVEGFINALKKSDREIIVAVYIEGIPINQVIKEIYFKMYDRTCEPKTINARLGKPIDDLIKIYNDEIEGLE